MTERFTGRRTTDVNLLGVFLCAVGGIGFYLSLREAFAYRILTAMGKEVPLPLLYRFYKEAFMPLLTILLLISGGGILQRRGWSRRLLFVLAVIAFSFFVILNIDALVRVGSGQLRLPIVIPVRLYLFIYLVWGSLIWFLLRKPVKVQFMTFEMLPEETKGDRISPTNLLGSSLSGWRRNGS